MGRVMWRRSSALLLLRRHAASSLPLPLFFSSTSASNADRIPTQDDPSPSPFPLPSFTNFLPFYPECLSVHQNAHQSRLFISDSLHNRILITDVHGNIFDSIGGSSPGFEDGEFESVTLSCPTASYYSHTSNCLYFVDSQNHALRRADLEKRLVDTIHPPYVKRSSGTWNWVLGKLGFGREVPLTTLELDSSSLQSPWHIVEIENDNLLVIDRSFQIAWVIGANDGLIRESIQGSSTILNFCGNAMKERISLLKDIYANLTIDKGKDVLSLFSSVASVDKYAIFIDRDSLRVMKYNMDSKTMSCLRFSNFKVLGLPNMLICPIERVFTSGLIEKHKEHVHYIKVLPGICNIKVFVDVPGGTELFEPLDEDCIWRQARGSGSEVSVLSQDSDLITNPEKVGVAQQWFDELDNLAFTEITDEITPDNRREELPSENTMDKRKAQFNCAVRTSPGTCEVVVTAILYLSIDNACENHEEQKLVVSRLLLDLCSSSQPKEIESFLENYGDLRDLVFGFPVHLRIKLECGDNPAAEIDKEIISTESAISINVTL